MRKCSYLLRIQKVLGVCSCAHVCAVFAHVYVWVLVGSCTALYLVVCSQGLSVNQELTSGLDCLANELSGSACFCLPSAVLWKPASMPAFYRVLGSKLRFFCLHRKHFIHWVMSVSLMLLLFFNSPISDLLPTMDVKGF